MSRLRLFPVRLVSAGALAAIVAFSWATLQIDARQAPFDPALYSGLHWRMLGPFRGGRTDAASGVPGRPNEFYFGSVNGGVWKSIDAGRVWVPVFDGQSVASIGALAVAPSSPDTVYVGTGESTLRDSTGYGDGMYKSTDAGKTWTHIGLEDTQHIGKVAVDPKNPNIVFVAVIGHLYESHPSRGVYKTIDGGKTWTKALFKSDAIGAIDVAIDPTNSKIVYASLWNTRRPTWYTYQPSNGPGGGIFKSIDGGTTWTELTKGLPQACIGRSGLAVSASNPKRVYAVVDDFLPEPMAPGREGVTPADAPPTGPCPSVPPSGGRGGGAQPPSQGGLYRSDDAGATWTKMSTQANEIAGLAGRGWYFETVAVDPKNPDVVYVSNVGVYRSKDGGKTWATVRGSPGGDDYHQPWVSPDDSNTIIIASDQGTIISRNALTDDPRDITWSSWLNQPIAQIYHVSSDYRSPYWVTGAQQDSGAVAVRSRGKFAGISMRDWEPIGAGGESGVTAGDPLHPGIIFGGTGARWDLEANGSAGRSGGQPMPQGEAARADWTQPLVFSKADPHALYYANQYVFKSTDDSQTWTRISGDLTRPDPGVPPNLDPVSANDTDRNGKRGVIYTIAPSPVLVPMVWIGTDDGVIQVTTDDGKTWQNVTPQALTAWSRVTTVEASHTNLNEAYASVDRHQLNDFNPHIFRTRDLGKTWQEITRGLPADAYVHVIKEDTKRPGLLFAGTERNVWASFDDGDNWQSLQLNLPVTSNRDFEVHGDDLIVATHGRGFWVIDDVSPLRQMNEAAASKGQAFLFTPAETELMAQGGDNGTPTQHDEAQTPNPPNGAAIDFFLKTAAAGPVSIEVIDASGQAVADCTIDPNTQPATPAMDTGFPPSTTLLWRATPERMTSSAGMHRWNWSPGGGGGRGGGGGGPICAGGAGGGGGRGGRGGAGGGRAGAPAAGAQVGAGAPPGPPAGGRGAGGGGRGGGGAAPLTGTFTVRLTVGGETYERPLVIKAEPRGR
jgi:photosystem II stability/assembly factor-like uncharacterized protein